MCSNAVFCLAYEWRSLMKCISGSSLSQASCAKGDGTIQADIHSVSPGHEAISKARQSAEAG
jgi:hypothetical protein